MVGGPPLFMTETFPPSLSSLLTPVAWSLLMAVVMVVLTMRHGEEVVEDGEARGGVLCREEEREEGRRNERAGGPEGTMTLTRVR